MLLAIDDDRWGRVDTKNSRSSPRAIQNVLAKIAIRKTRINLIRAQPTELGDALERAEQVARCRPVTLLREQDVNKAQEFVLAAATRNHGGRKCRIIERKITIEDAELARIHVVFLQLFIRTIVEGSDRHQ